MNEFVHSFWSMAIAVVTLAGIVACVILLIVSGRTTVTGSEDGSTGHVWDEDLKEMNNPLPRWWVGLFLITVVFALGYLVMYPGLGSREGSLMWSSHDEHKKLQQAYQEKYAPLLAKVAQQSFGELAGQRSLMLTAERIFLNNCAQCHGSDAKGSKGFPNLADTDWLHGNTEEQLIQTISKGRTAVMPAMAAAVGDAAQVSNLSHYVLSLSGSAHDPVKAALGKPKFAACAACHGAKGEGNQALGAPNLTDKVWLHGWGEQAISKAILNGLNNQMPAQENKLSDNEIRLLAAYVWAKGR
jgi:cytochrome c oxidase cbb3-type subunit III